MTATASNNTLASRGQTAVFAQALHQLETIMPLQQNSGVTARDYNRLMFIKATGMFLTKAL